jgi:hypothetical protein
LETEKLDSLQHTYFSSKSEMLPLKAPTIYFKNSLLRRILELKRDSPKGD